MSRVGASRVWPWIGVAVMLVLTAAGANSATAAGVLVSPSIVEAEGGLLEPVQIHNLGCEPAVVSWQVGLFDQDDQGRLAALLDPAAEAEAEQVLGVTADSTVLAGGAVQTLVPQPVGGLKEPVYPLLVVQVQAGGVGYRFKIPFFLMREDEDPNFELVTVVWREDSVGLLISNQGDVHGRLDLQGGIVDGTASRLQALEICSGRILPGRKRWITVPLPVEAEGLVLEQGAVWRHDS